MDRGYLWRKNTWREPKLITNPWIRTRTFIKWPSQILPRRGRKQSLKLQGLFGYTVTCKIGFVPFRLVLLVLLLLAMWFYFHSIYCRNCSWTSEGTESAARRQVLVEEVSRKVYGLGILTYGQRHVMDAPSKSSTLFTFDKNQCYMQWIDIFNAKCFARPQIPALVARMYRQLHMPALRLRTDQLDVASPSLQPREAKRRQHVYKRLRIILVGRRYHRQPGTDARPS